MQRTDFHFELPHELIAQRPVTPRSASRLLALDGGSCAWRDLNFSDLPSLLNAEDLLVFNDTRVVPARVLGSKPSGGKVELLLERVLSVRTALVHARSSKGLKPGATVELPGGEQARMLGREGNLFKMEFSADALKFFQDHGDVPLPPYIHRAPDADDRERYQTIFARSPGAVAAPTAGLHFDQDLLAALDSRRARRAFVTLHVGAGTFQPVRVNDIEEHQMHTEYLEVSQAACAAINAARAAGGRVIAVGTTVVRSLESAAAAAGTGRTGLLRPFSGPTQIFIKPGDRFRVVDALVTNFHLPESTLLMLCAAFVGIDALKRAYAHAIEARYRFFSYGDAMFLTPSASALEPG